MTALLFIAIAVAGGIGALARLLLDELVSAHLNDAAPWGTITVNLTGSLALGAAAGFAAGHILPEDWFLVIGTGLLGGYTTFSTASFDAVRLAQERRFTASGLVAFGTLIVATTAAGLGFVLGSLA